MKALKYVLITPILAAAFSSQAAYLDLRGAYATEAKQWEHRARAGLDFADAWQVHLEGTQGHGKDLFSDKTQSVSAFETEVNYNYKSANNLTWSPGFVYWAGRDHVEYRPYLKLTWSPGPYYIAGRYRYQSATGDANNTNQFDAWFGYAFEAVSLEYNPAYIARDDVSFKNDGSLKDNKWEHTFQAKYTGFETWSPYLEFQLLDNINKGTASAPDVTEEKRWRFGVTWVF
ncbi:oligogalacturonate-specific porin KdgM family protein [Alginatibacterium sediminis]|nr:oligogalacturonate-specific porin KdgM family protein [Alginatibacterium sediminis]